MIAMATALLLASQAAPDPAPTALPPPPPIADVAVTQQIEAVPAANPVPGTSTEPATVDPGEEPVPADSVPEIIVEGSLAPPPGDPLARLNAQTFEVVQQVDEAVVEPLASGYQNALPNPVRKGLFNFFSNLREPVVFLNFLLQGKPGKAIETLGRFAVNSTVGIAGLVDVAKDQPFNLPRRRNGFANTLAIYGVKEGAFLVVPLVGPTTVRDLIGTLVDNAAVPTLAGKPFTEPYFALPAFTVISLESRIEIDEKLKAIRNSDDPYTSMRETYLRERQAEIDALRGRAPATTSDPKLEPEPAHPASVLHDSVPPESIPQKN